MSYQRDYNQRQYGWMAYFIEQYQLGRISLSEIIGKLEGLLSVLQTPNAEWEDKFRSAWGQLEIVYAVNHNIPALSEQDTLIISEALIELAELVRVKLDSSQIDNNAPQ